MKRKSLLAMRSFWIALCPLILLLAVVTWWVGIQLTAAISIRHRIHQIRSAGLPYDELSLSKHFFASSSQASSSAWFEVMHPIFNVTQAGYRAESSSVPREPSENAPNENRLVREAWERDLDKALLAGAEPLLRRLRQLTQKPSTVWIPLVFDEELDHGRQNKLAPDGIVDVCSRLAATEFVYAVKEKQYDRAIQALRTESGCLAAFDWLASIAGDSYRSDLLSKQYRRTQEALNDASWNDEQLLELSQIVGPMPDIAKRWQSVIEAERAMTLGGLGATNFRLTYDIEFLVNNQRQPTNTVTIAATRMNRILQAIDDDVRIGESGYFGLVMRAQNARAAQWYAALTATSISDCFLSHRDLRDTLAPYLPAVTTYADQLKSTETKRRLVLTTIGLHRYRLANNHWPESLDDLRSVGLSLQDWTSVDEGAFEYHVDIDSDTATIDNERVSAVDGS